MRQLILVRHGQSKVQADGGVTHHVPGTPLSRLGVVQARLAAKRLETFGIGTIYSSEYERAAQTARIVGERLGVDVRRTALLNESRRLPSEFQGMLTGTQDEKMINAQIAKHRYDRTWHYEDEENMYDGILRSGRFFALAKKDRHDVVLAVTHDGTIRLLLGHVLLGRDAPLEQHWRLHWSMITSNASISRLEHRKGWGWNLTLYNDCSHLKRGL